MGIKNILCVSDLSSISLNAGYAAVRLAHRFNANLTILSCGEYYSHSPNHYFDDNSRQPVNDNLHSADYIQFVNQKSNETIDIFNKIQNELNINLKEKILFEIKLENEVSATLDLLHTAHPKYDLIVVGKENTSHWERILFGSPAKEICDETKIPTLLVPSANDWLTWLPTGILACTSLHHDKDGVENIGTQLAAKYNIPFTLIHVIDTSNQGLVNSFANICPIDYIPPLNSSAPSIAEIKEETKKELENIISKLKHEFNYNDIAGHIELGRIGESILNYLNSNPKNNLLIVGSRGENTLKRFFLGSQTDVIEELSPIPVLIVFHTE